MENRVSKILNIEKPIIQGPMNGLPNANFVASVSEAGGLGILGPNAGEARITNSQFETAEKMRLEVKKVKKLTSKPFASTIMVSEDLSYTSYLIDMLIEENISAVLING
ncbi:nitronate monooxygenase, partial [Staphylococcus aureus]|uniref:nitronate monooxygenase n=1 Tax=Staphylococcus aureus TaxID=1280 RepID=UPI000B0714B6